MTNDLRQAALHDKTIFAHIKQYELGLVSKEEMYKLLIIALAKEKAFYQQQCEKLISTSAKPADIVFNSRLDNERRVR